jgi:uncharacterized protein YcfJ
MLTRFVTGVVVSGMALAAQSAMAGGHQGQYRGDSRNFEPGYDYGRVVAVDPLVNRVRVSVPTQDCFDETRYEEGGYRRTTNGKVGATLVGGLLGAVVGSQFGHGDGRRVATVAGAALGAAVGNQTATSNRGERGYYEEPRAYPVQRCQTRYEDRYEERIEGYRVSYVYDGRRYTTQMPYDPGERIRIRVDVRPAGF